MQVFFDPDIEGAKLKVKNELKLGWCGLGRKSSSKAVFTLLSPTFSCCECGSLFFLREGSRMKIMDIHKGLGTAPHTKNTQEQQPES